MTSETVAERFGLRRDNFILDPVADTDCFARVDINTHEIAESLEIDVVTGLAPKRLVFGPYGAGKTHTLMRTMVELGKLTPIHAVRVECPDLSKRSKFHDLYREGIMRALGQDFVLGLMENVVHEVGFKKREELNSALKEWFGDQEISRAAERLYDPNFDRLKLWRWISGVGLSRAELDALGQTQDLTEAEAARLSGVLIMLGGLLRRLRGETLVLILDEMERLRSIGQDTIDTVQSGLARLVDPNQKSTCVLIGASGVTESELIDLFSSASPVGSRLGADARLEIPALHDMDVEKFIEKVNEYVWDREGFDRAAAVAARSTSTPEKVDTASFPFTREAIEALKAKTQSLLPRQIMLQMTRALGRAYRERLDVITSDCVV